MIVRKPLDPEQNWFPQARFGMFIHFGLYALLGRGEWVMYNENIPREEYEKLQQRFNPRRFCAEEWVAAAQKSGCRYITITAKHHDGFCLFDSALTDYKITRTPFGRDLIGELIAACHEADMRICLYYSQPDWHHKNFVHRPKAFKDLPYTRPDDEPNWPAYLRYYIGQVRELCTNYGRIDGIWFDGVQRTEQEWQGRRVYRLIRALQPHAVVNDRAGYGDFFTPERTLAEGPAAAGYMVEACQSVAEVAWGYHKDTALYSAEALLEALVKMAAANGNYLLNIGPTPEGTLPEEWLQRFYEIGEWLASHGESIYGTQGCPGQHESATMLYTRRGRKLYLHLLQWPGADRVRLQRLRTVPASARLLKTKQRLRIMAAGKEVELQGLPARAPSWGVNVIEMTFATDKMLQPAVRAGERLDAGQLCVAEGPEVYLSAEGAGLRGFGFKGYVLRKEVLRPAEWRLTRPAEVAINAYWMPEQTAEWRVRLAAPAVYRVAVQMACPSPYEGTEFVLEGAGQKLRGVVPDTGGERQFAPVEIGKIKLPAGESILRLHPTKPKYAFFFAHVKGLQLWQEES